MRKCVTKEDLLTVFPEGREPTNGTPEKDLIWWFCWEQADFVRTREVAEMIRDGGEPVTIDDVVSQVNQDIDEGINTLDEILNLIRNFYDL